MKKMIPLFILGFATFANADIYDRIDSCESNPGWSCLFDILREIVSTNSGNGANTTLVKSDGTRSKPHCSWSNQCEWSQQIKEECAQALCEANGYTLGTFARASNNMCESSFISSYIYVWSVDRDKIFKQTGDGKETQIIAHCE